MKTILKTIRTIIGLRSAKKDTPINHDGAYEFEVLGGPVYLQGHRPPVWCNEAPLRSDRIVRANPPEMEKLPLADFPLIDDFELRLESMKSQGQPVFGYHVEFFSHTRGYVTSFPWWDNAERDLIRDDFQIPLGDIQEPFHDVEQGWEIVIASDHDYVYILQGDFDAPVGEGYYAWFKVTKGTYLAKWQEAIVLCRKTFIQ